MSSDHSRRRLLRSLSVAGTLGFVGGAGTYAALSDEAVVEGNALQSGALDLEVAATGADGGPPAPPTTFSDETVVTVPFDDVRRGDTGGATIAVRSCDNPGRVWLRTHGAVDSPLATATRVELVSRVPCDGSSESVLYEGTLAGLSDALSDGLLLGRDTTATATVEYESGQFIVESEDGSDGEVRSRDPPQFAFDTPDGEVVVELRNVQTKEGDEIVSVDAVVLDGGTLDAVSVTGGGGPGVDRTVRYDPSGCRRRLTDLQPPENPNNDTRFELSNAVFEFCGSAVCLECPPGCLELTWELPTDAPDAVTGETAELVVEFSARQCRHTTPRNPW
ncbi:hypothetical protein RYH80_14795 [Halobaculum sp. MBLA0147]|uniref:hypothetical protein n=1 Tax=Halobaculum sp. MBLA0147 TaxID=3079934 RepID=UPI0035237186